MRNSNIDLELESINLQEPDIFLGKNLLMELLNLAFYHN